MTRSWWPSEGARNTPISGSKSRKPRCREAVATGRNSFLDFARACRYYQDSPSPTGTASGACLSGVSRFVVPIPQPRRHHERPTTPPQLRGHAPRSDCQSGGLVYPVGAGRPPTVWDSRGTARGSYVPFWNRRRPPRLDERGSKAMQINELAAATGTAAGGMGIACPAAVFQGTASSNDIGYEGVIPHPPPSIRSRCVRAWTDHRTRHRAPSDLPGW